MAVSSADLAKLIRLPADFDDAGVISLAASIRSEYLAASGLSVGKLDTIELLLAAHFAVLAEERGGLKRQSIKDTSETYREIDPKQIGLRSTRFGQQAVMLDTSQTLLTMATKFGSAELRVV